MGKQLGKKIDFEELQKGREEKVKSFEKLRKKRRRMQMSKRVMWLCVIAGVVAGIVALNAFLIETAISVKVSDIIESFGGSGYPVQVPGGVIRNVRSMGRDLVVLNDTNLYIYNSKGKVTTNLQQMNDHTVMVPSGDRILTYSVGGKRYNINTRSRNIISGETEFGILCGDLNGRGHYAIAAASRQYVAQVTMYNSKGEMIFGWASADNPVAGVSVSPRGDKLAVSCVNTFQGVLKTLLLVFDTDTQREVLRVEYSDEMPMELLFADNDSILLLTDRSCYRVYIEGTTSAARYTLPEGRLQAVERRGKETLMLFTQPDTREQQLVWLDEDLRHVSSLAPQERVKDIALADRYAYILTDTGILTFNRDFEQRTRYEQRGINSIHLVNNRLYYFTREEIYAYIGN